MERERWLQVKELFAAALDVPLDRREEYLVAANDDAVVRAEVVEMLRAHGSAGAFLGAPTVDPEYGTAVPDGESESDFPDRLGDFRLLRRLGGGGMGVVYLARQESLGRDVALKIVRRDNLYFAGARERFRREVEAVARLKHPGIVPILCVGEEGGLPYFAMEWVEGCSLAEVLAELAASTGNARPTGADLLAVVSAGSDSPEDDDERLYSGSWAQVVLRIVRRVAQALNHAHERGIVHRDVKPSNIMLTPGGQVLLVDFGIARLQGSTGITRTGSTLGSLPYMPPEQVRGGVDLDERTDVYALGVTLYEALTRQAPFRDADTERLRQAILDGRPVQPRTVDPGIPRDVETVCLKAMDADRQRRYPTMADFAHDLDNCLELRPIHARRAGPIVRARRFVQRNPAVAAALGLGLVLVVGTPSALWLQQRRANLRLSAESTRAQQSLVHALEAVHEMLTVVAEEQLREIPRMKSVRLDLLDRARRFFDAFLSVEGDDPEVRRQAARIHGRLGNLQLELGRPDDALESFTEARRLMATVAGEGKVDSNDLLHLAQSLRGSGRVHADRRAFEPAESFYREALQLHDRVLAEHPLDAEQRASHCSTLNHLAALRILENRDEEAVALRQRSVAEMEQVVASSPEEIRFKVQLGGLCASLGAVMRRLDRYQEGVDAGLRAMTLLEEVLAEKPTQSCREDLVRALHVLAFNYTCSGREVEAEQSYRRALEIAEALVRDHPSTPDYLSSVGGAANNIGQILIGWGRHEEAREMLERAVAAQKGALAIVPNHAHYLSILRNHYVNLCTAVMHLGRADDLHAATDALVALREDSFWWTLDAAVNTMLYANLLEGMDLPPEERQRQQKLEHERAMRFLLIAEERGAGLRNLADYWVAGLRGRPDFEAMMGRLRARARAGGDR